MILPTIREAVLAGDGACEVVVSLRVDALSVVNDFCTVLSDEGMTVLSNDFCTVLSDKDVTVLSDEDATVLSDEGMTVLADESVMEVGGCSILVSLRVDIFPTLLEAFFCTSPSDWGGVCLVVNALLILDAVTVGVVLLAESPSLLVEIFVGARILVPAIVCVLGVLLKAGAGPLFTVGVGTLTCEEALPEKAVGMCDGAALAGDVPLLDVSTAADAAFAITGAFKSGVILCGFAKTVCVLVSTDILLPGAAVCVLVTTEVLPLDATLSGFVTVGVLLFEDTLPAFVTGEVLLPEATVCIFAVAEVLLPGVTTAAADLSSPSAAFVRVRSNVGERLGLGVVRTLADRV
jgi:hypothetical protein